MSFTTDVVTAAHRRVVFPRRIRVLADHIRGVVPEGARSLLDVGCGDGTLCRLVADGLPGLMTAGLEVHLRPTTAIPVRLFDGRQIPLPDRSVDVVLFVDVLHHTDDPLVLLQEAARVARRALIVKDHLADPWLGRWRLRAMDWIGNIGHGVRLPYNYWTRAQWANGFTAAGLLEDRHVEVRGLYTPVMRPLFERGLHFIARLAPRG